MARYYGTIGFQTTEESVDEPGVWERKIVERKYYGDVIRNTRRWENGVGANSDFVLSNQLSIIADPYAFENLGIIKYVTWMKKKWFIRSIDVNYPRLILTLGGLYEKNDEEGT